MYIDIDGLFRWCACLWNRVVAWVRFTIRNYLSAYIAFSATPSSDRYAVHVSVDMTACPWKFNYGDHHVSSRDSHEASPTNGTTPPDVCLTPLGRTAPLPLCAWHLGHLKCGEHQVSTTATRDSHDAARTHETTRPPTCGSPSWPHRPSAYRSITCGPVTYRVHMLLTQR